MLPWSTAVLLRLPNTAVLDIHSVPLSPFSPTPSKWTHLLNACFILWCTGCEPSKPPANTIKSSCSSMRNAGWLSDRRKEHLSSFCTAACLCGSLCGTRHQRVSALFEDSLRHFHTYTFRNTSREGFRRTQNKHACSHSGSYAHTNGDGSIRCAERFSLSNNIHTVSPL